MTKPRAAVIYNPVRVNLSRLRKVVTAAEKTHGWAESTWIPTTPRPTADDLVDDALASGADLVVAAGGDGTVRSVGTAMRGRDMPFGIIPSGTANLLARNVRLPLTDQAAAARIAFGPQERRIDVGLLDYRLDDGTNDSFPFLVIAGFGIDADMVAGTDPRLKRRFGWLAYIGGIARGLSRRSGERVTYSLDGGAVVSTRVHTLLVGNCGTITAGIRVLPEALVDDGLLDVLSVRSGAIRDQATVFRWLSSYTFPNNRTAADRALAAGDSLHYTKAREVTMTLERARPMQADGDAIGDVVWARLGIDPGALRIKVPATVRPGLRLQSPGRPSSAASRQ